MLSIDEAIEQFEYDAQCNRADLDLSYAEDNEQIAEWLKLLKWYEQGMEDIPSESGVLPKDVYHAGYNKAIDDFVKLVHKHDWNIRNINENSFIYGAIDTLAEQLKAGGKNDNLRR